MVLIEPVQIPSSEPKPKPNPEPEPTTTKTSSAAATSSVPVQSPSGYNSDGYETASDTELNTDSENEELKKSKDLGNSEENDNHDTTIETQSSTNVDPEKALGQANDAKLEGNALFKEGKYEEALLKYELALQFAPDLPSSDELRSICHANRGACFSKLGQHKETVKECTKGLELNPSYSKALIRRGEANEKLENYEDAIADMTKILELDPSNDQARRTIYRLKPLADEKREKMKEEMIGKLKEMGNSVLGRFGMSIDNFKAVQDPKTGSYSLSFQR